MKRREMLMRSLPMGIGMCSLPLMSFKFNSKDNCLKDQVELIREMDNGSISWIWSILKGITKEELDWKINEEANTIRWIIGHLTWFEEWACDAINEKGLYLIKNQPSTSFQSDSLETMKSRLNKAHKQYDALVKALSVQEIQSPRKYLYNDHDDKRADVDLKTILEIHCTHFFGHLYQIRMIRGTYSRVHKTDKTKFDKW